MVTDSYVQVAQDGIGKQLDTSQVTVGANTVHRERVNVSDPTDPAAHQAVKNTAPTSGDYGAVVRVGDGHDVAEGLTTDAAVVTDANGTLSGKLRGLVKWAFERMPASLGQKAMSESVPVVMASDQTALADVTASATLGALNDAVTIALAGYGGVGVFIPAAGTLVATITLEVSMDGGTTFSIANTISTNNNGSLGSTITLTNPNTLQQLGVLTVPGVSHVRARVSAYTSGSATATLRKVNNPQTVFTFVRAANTAAPASAALVGGMDASALLQALQVRTAPPAASDLGLLMRIIQPTTFSLDTYTAVGAGVVIDIVNNPVKSYSVQVNSNGGLATAWDVRLEGGLDGSNFTQILQHTNVTGNLVTVFSGAVFSPTFRFRTRVAGLTLGPATSITVIGLGMP